MAHTACRAVRPSSWPDVRVACVWLPALPLRVAVLRRPEWDGRPLVLAGGGTSGGTGTAGDPRSVLFCSPEAARDGVRPGLPLREVRALCPDAIIVRPDPVRVAAARDALLDRLRRVSPSVEPADEDLFLDLRGLAGVYHDDVDRLERAIRVAVPAALHPQVGLAHGKATAAIAARRAPPVGRTIIRAGESVAFLAPLSARYLPLTPEEIGWLERLGLRTIGDLARLPFSAVQAQLGTPGAYAWRLAHGHDDAPIVPRFRERSARARFRPDDPLASVDAIGAAVDRLVGAAFAAPTLAGHAARRARLRALLTDGTSWEQTWTFKDALANPAVARRALGAKLALPNGLPPAPVEELALELLDLGGETARQPGLLTARARQLGQIVEVARHLAARYGHVPLYRAVEVEPWSRIPERRWALAPIES